LAIKSKRQGLTICPKIKRHFVNANPSNHVQPNHVQSVNVE
jgi:hypothetical protein